MLTEKLAWKLLWILWLNPDRQRQNEPLVLGYSALCACIQTLLSSGFISQRTRESMGNKISKSLGGMTYLYPRDTDGGYSRASYCMKQYYRMRSNHKSQKHNNRRKKSR